MLKDIHLATKDICNILNIEAGMWKVITYPIWFVILFVSAINNKYIKKDTENKSVLETFSATNN